MDLCGYAAGYGLSFAGCKKSMVALLGENFGDGDLKNISTTFHGENKNY
jgi:hypothetical protein